jgi:hypothetical protein
MQYYCCCCCCFDGKILDSAYSMSVRQLRRTNLAPGKAPDECPQSPNSDVVVVAVVVADDAETMLL